MVIHPPVLESAIFQPIKIIQGVITIFSKVIVARRAFMNPYIPWALSLEE
jgi:hypothetical protein